MSSRQHRNQNELRNSNLPKWSLSPLGSGHASDYPAPTHDFLGLGVLCPLFLKAANAERWHLRQSRSDYAEVCSATRSGTVVSGGKRSKRSIRGTMTSQNVISAYELGRPIVAFETPYSGSDKAFAAKRYDGAVIESPSYEHCTFANLGFKEAKFQNGYFLNCIFIGCYFRRAVITNCNFVGCQFF